MARLHSDDLVDPRLLLRCETGITAKRRLQLDRAVQVEIARAKGSVDAPIGRCSRDPHSAVGRCERLVERDAGVCAERSLTPFDDSQAHPEEAQADNEIVIVGDEADRDKALEMGEKLEDVGRDGEARKVAYAHAGVQARRPAVDRRFEMPRRGKGGQGNGRRASRSADRLPALAGKRSRRVRSLSPVRCPA